MVTAGLYLQVMKTLAIKIRQIARHGQDKRYHHKIIGLNSRLDSIQAAVLLAKLTIFDDELEARTRLHLSTYQSFLRLAFDQSQLLVLITKVLGLNLQ